MPEGHASFSEITMEIETEFDECMIDKIEQNGNEESGSKEEIPTYQIHNWNKFFESSETRKIKNGLRAVLVPTKHDGKSYRRLMRHENGPALYGVWIVILQVAAKCPARGVLADEDGPLTAEDIDLKTGVSEQLIQEALDVLSCPKIGWITVVFKDASGESPGTSGDSRGTPGDDPRTSPQPAEKVVTTDGMITEHNCSESDSESETGAPLRATGQSESDSKRPSVFRRITESVLRDTVQLRSWFDWQAKPPDGMSQVLSSSVGNWLHCLQAAEQSLARGDPPVALFRHIVGTGNFSKINKKSKASAEKRFNEWKGKSHAA